MFDLFRDRPQGRGRPASARRRDGLKLEALEDRAVPAVIGGVVYSDLNNNGIRNATENGLSGVTLELRDTQNRVLATTTTDSFGRYVFTQRQVFDSAPGSVSFEATFDPARTNLTRSATLPKFDGSLGQLTSVEIIAEGGTSSNVVIENLDPTTAKVKADLSTQIVYTVGGTRVQGEDSTTVNANLAAFDGQMDMEGTSARDFGNTPLTADFAPTTLTSAEDLAAFIGTGTVSVTQDATATSCACGPGNLLSMIRSTAKGKVKVVYHYSPSSSIGPGQYTVVETAQPPGFTDGLETKNNVTPIVGSRATDQITVGVVNDGDSLTSNNFGELRRGSISGIVYHDADLSRSLTNADRRIGGVTVNLTGTDVYGNAVALSTTTASNGAYSFAGLAVGTYTVSEVQPDGYLQGTNTLGSYRGRIRGDTMTLSLPPAGAATRYNFGEVVRSARPPEPQVSIPEPSKFLLIGRNLNGFTW